MTHHRPFARPASVAVLLALILALLAPGSAAPARADDQWTIRPSSTEGPDDRISLRHEIEPGQAISDHVAVTNLGVNDAVFTVQVGDGVLGANGAFDIDAGEPTGGGTWVEVGGLDDGTVPVPAGDTVVLPVTIRVPDDATPGDHPAGITVASSQADGDVTVTYRVGVRLHLRVAGDIESTLAVSVVDTDFRSSWIPFAPGTLQVRYRIENTGTVRLGAGTRVDASGVFGIAAATGELVTTDELLPGDAVTDVVEFEVWPVGYVSGAVETSGLAVGQDEVGDPGAASADYSRPAISWTGLLVLALLAGAVVRYRSRSATRPGPEGDATEADSPDEAAPMVRSGG